MVWRGDRSGAYLAPSLCAFFDQADRKWPGRKRGADGTIGDASHQARRSDHNPAWHDSDEYGIVRAGDITNDPHGGPDCSVISEQLRKNQDSRVRYCIFNRRVWHDGSISKMFDVSMPQAYTWYAYKGPSAHTAHMHVSIKRNKTAANDVRSWFDKSATPPVEPTKEWDELATKKEIEEVVRAVLVDVLNDGAGPGQRDWAGTSAATLANVQSLHNLVKSRTGQVYNQVAGLNGKVVGMTTALDRVTDSKLDLAAIADAAEEGVRRALADATVETDEK